MKFREIHFRVVLFIAAILSILWGYQVLFLHHAPDVFNDPLEDMSHGWLVPFVSLYVLWNERDQIIKSVGSPVLSGLPLLVFSCFVGFLGVRGVQVRLEIVGLIGVLLGLVWCVFGRKTMQKVLFPCLFLLFCLPLHTYLDLITIHLRMLAVSIAYWALEVLGVDAVRTGTMICSESGKFAIDIADPCSGLRSLFALLALSTAYSYFAQSKWSRRSILIIISIPLSILGNSVRILSIVLVAANFSNDFALGFYHDYSGYIVYFVAISLLVGCDKLLGRGGKPCAKS